MKYANSRKLAAAVKQLRHTVSTGFYFIASTAARALGCTAHNRTGNTGNINRHKTTMMSSSGHILGCLAP